MSDTTQVPNTEDDILSGVEGLEDEPIVEDGAKGEATPTGVEDEAIGVGGEQGAGKGAEGQQQQKPSGPQDLVDSNGTIIATGGRERRFYETAQKEKGQRVKLEQEVASLSSQMEAVNAAGNLGTQYNLTPEEVTTGAQIIAAYKTNPVETLQYMLTQAQAQGHNIEGIGGGNMDLGAVKSMITTALEPLLAEQTERVDTQETEQAALEFYEEFSTNFPDAAPHEDTLARLLREQPSLSPEAAYFKLKTYYLERGLPFSKSLATLQQEHQANGPRENTQQGLPDGGVAVNAATDTSQVANTDVSYDDIIRESIKEAGIS